MKLFIIKLLVFIILFLGCILSLLIILPFNEEGHNCAYLVKNELLRNEESPRIILVGGSNVAMGFDCALISDSLHIKVINSGVHAGIGLQFMMSDIAENAGENDIIVISPEYSHFFGESAYGSLPLADIILHIAPEKIKLLTWKQWGCVINNMPGHFISRIMYLSQKEVALFESVYSMRYVNKLNGDSFGHWSLPNRAFVHYENSGKGFNEAFFSFFMMKIDELKKKKCKVYLLPPVLAQTTYNNIIENIKQVENKLNENGVAFVNAPSKYCFADTLFFDSPYHVNREGITKRSNLFVDEFKFLKNGK